MKTTENEAAIKGFEFVPSGTWHTLIRGKPTGGGGKGEQILGYRLRLPPHLIEKLKQTTTMLPKIAKKNEGRGNFCKRHYALWADYAHHPYYNSEFLKDGEAGIRWLEANLELFQYLSNVLRFVDPEGYLRMTTHKWLDGLMVKGGVHLGQKGGQELASRPLHKLAGAWCGLVINQDQTRGGVPHRDWEDVKKGYNCVVPYGDWEGGDLLLWELRKRVEIVEGDAFFFRGSVITHNVWNIHEGGVRHGIDLFTHQNVLDRDKKQREKAGVRAPKAKRSGRGYPAKRPREDVGTGKECGKESGRKGGNVAADRRARRKSLKAKARAVEDAEDVEEEEE